MGNIADKAVPHCDQQMLPQRPEGRLSPAVFLHSYFAPITTPAKRMGGLPTGSRSSLVGVFMRSAPYRMHAALRPGTRLSGGSTRGPGDHIRVRLDEQQETDTPAGRGDPHRDRARHRAGASPRGDRVSNWKVVTSCDRSRIASPDAGVIPGRLRRAQRDTTKNPLLRV